MLSDLAITQACARAINVKIEHVQHGMAYFIYHPISAPLPLFHPYDPLTDDAQCMALVKRFGIGFDPTRGEDFASAAIRDEHGTMLIFCDPSLNRAICLCVAHMQLTKEAKHAE